MIFTQPLLSGRLIRRYKRFLADICLDRGDTVTAHCPNPGAMTGLAEPGTRVLVEPVDSPKRKLKFTWRLVDLGGGQMAGIDTSVPNRVVAEALAARRIPGLDAFARLRPETRYGRNSRVDFLLEGPEGAQTWLEVKNVHLVRRPGLAEFPDCVTRRGATHLDELAVRAAAGDRAVMLYVVQRTDCTALALAGDIDPGYLAASRRARAVGVEAMAWACRIAPKEIALDRPIPIAEDRGQGQQWTGS